MSIFIIDIPYYHLADYPLLVYPLILFICAAYPQYNYWPYRSLSWKIVLAFNIIWAFKSKKYRPALLAASCAGLSPAAQQNRRISWSSWCSNDGRTYFTNRLLFQRLYQSFSSGCLSLFQFHHILRSGNISNWYLLFFVLVVDLSDYINLIVHIKSKISSA